MRYDFKLYQFGGVFFGMISIYVYLIGMRVSGDVIFAHPLSPLQPAQVADHAVPHTAIEAFASLGNMGLHPSNQERDLHRWTKRHWGLSLQPYIVHLDLVPFQNEKCCVRSFRTFETISHQI